MYRRVFNPRSNTTNSENSLALAETQYCCYRSLCIRFAIHLPSIQLIYCWRNPINIRLCPLVLIATSITRLKPCLGVLVLIMFAGNVKAHEFWLEKLSISDQLAGLTARQGEGLSGEQIPLQAHPEARWWLASSTDIAETVAEYKPDGSVGIALTNSPEWIAYRSGAAINQYQEFDEFATFAEEEHLAWAADLHLSKDYPKENFSEVFYRHTKVIYCHRAQEIDNDSSSIDYEWVIVDNGSSDDLTESTTSWRLKVLTPNQMTRPLPVHVFSIDEQGTRKVKRVQTDGSGFLDLNVTPNSQYLISTTSLLLPTARTMLKTSAIWESHWVSLRFSSSDNCSS